VDRKRAKERGNYSDVNAWVEAFCSSITSGKLGFVPRRVEAVLYDALGTSKKQIEEAIKYQKDNPDSSTQVSRENLIKFANDKNYHPKFLDGV
jgi:hypothetical protein